MEKKEIYFWLAMIKQARCGSKDATGMLEAENEIRKKQNRQSIEEELLEIADLLDEKKLELK